MSWTKITLSGWHPKKPKKNKRQAAPTGRVEVQEARVRVLVRGEGGGAGRPLLRWVFKDQLTFPD